MGLKTVKKKNVSIFGESIEEMNKRSEKEERGKKQVEGKMVLFATRGQHLFSGIEVISRYYTKTDNADGNKFEDVSTKTLDYYTVNTLLSLIEETTGTIRDLLDKWDLVERGKEVELPFAIPCFGEKYQAEKNKEKEVSHA